MSSTSIYTASQISRSNFKPTYLMIKQHEITGLKYLCKTITKYPNQYKGSGKYWKSHLKQHGSQYVKTIWYKLYTDIDELVSIALTLSELYDIVESDSWANLTPENGLDGIDAKTASITAISTNNTRLKNGTHLFLNNEFQRNLTLTRINNNTHNFQTEQHKIDVTNNNYKLSARPEYLELKLLYKQFKVKQPKFLHMKSIETLNKLKFELLASLGN